MESSLFDLRNPKRLLRGHLDSSKIGPAGEFLHLFSTPFYVAKAELNVSPWHTELRQLVERRYREDPDRYRESWNRFDDREWQEDCIIGFQEFYVAHLYRYLSYYIPKERLPAVTWHWKAWINVKTGLGWHQMHYHEGASLSFVYYLRAPKPECRETLKKKRFESESYGGVLEFLDPRGAAPYMSNRLLENSNENGKFFIQPEEGTFCIFPSWLNHGVAPVLSDELRISVAGNFSQIRFRD